MTMTVLVSRLTVAFAWSTRLCLALTGVPDDYLSFVQ